MGALESPGATCCHTDERGLNFKKDLCKGNGDLKDGAGGPMWEMRPVEGLVCWLA